MRLILGSHSEVKCYDETESYKLLVAGNMRQVLLESAQRYVGFKIPRFSEQLLQETMTDTDYGAFPTFYRGEPVIYMVRDYRDVVRSMVSLTYPDGESWLEKYGKNILLSKASENTLSAENLELLSVVEREGFPSYLVGALYWKYKTEAVFDFLGACMPVRIVCYERLVMNPESELGRVVRFLSLQWEDSLLSHHRLEHEEIDEQGLAIGGTNPRLAIHADSVRRHKEYFSVQQVEKMRHLVTGTLARLVDIGIVYD